MIIRFSEKAEGKIVTVIQLSRRAPAGWAFNECRNQKKDLNQDLVEDKDTETYVYFMMVFFAAEVLIIIYIFYEHCQDNNKSTD